MSTLLRLLRSSRPPTTLRTLRTPTSNRHVSQNYFSPSHTRLSGSNHLNLSRSRSYTSWNNFQSNAAANHRVLYGLMGVNFAIFGYGYYVKEQAKAGYPAGYMKFMHNMSCNLTEFKNGAWWQILTSNFTHTSFGHFLGNMFTAYFLGGFLCNAAVITPVHFLTIAVGSGVAGSLGYLYNRYQAVGDRGIDGKRGLGFSGCLMGITSVAACLSPTAKVYIYGIVPLPLWATVAGYALYDGYYINDNQSRIAHAGHLGGLAFGIAYYLLRLRGLRF